MSDEILRYSTAQPSSCLHCLVLELCTQILKDSIRTPQVVIGALLEVAAELIVAYCPVEVLDNDPEGMARWLVEQVKKHRSLNESSKNVN
jgi:hypothetical protein